VLHIMVDMKTVSVSKYELHYNVNSNVSITVTALATASMICCTLTQNYITCA